jgi:two-component system sensor histidine kinase HydH
LQSPPAMGSTRQSDGGGWFRPLTSDATSGTTGAMSGPELHSELFDYIGFSDDDAAQLRALGPRLRPHFPRVVDEFYAALRSNPRSAAVFTGGAPQIARQKSKLRQWLEGLVGGTYDAAYLEQRGRIGRVHVQIKLDQRFMFSAMNLIRQGLHDAVSEARLPEEEAHASHRALDRILDVELAIMLETYRERYVERQRASERLATIGQLAASIGHELRNPLAVIETSAHLLRRNLDDEDGRTRRHVDKITQQIGISSQIISDLLALARDRPPTREQVDLNELVAEVVAAVPVPPDAALTTDIEAEVGDIWVDRSQFRQVLVNLITNAVQALGSKGGGVRVRARVDAGETLLEVDDDGPGFAPEVLERLFEPLVTTRASGIGLGLALCARIVEKHGGQIEVGNLDGGGARVAVTLPRRR